MVYSKFRIYHFYKEGCVMKAIIFDVGGTLLENENFDFQKGLKYLYDEILDIKESYDDYLKFIDSFYDVFERRKNSDLEVNFQSYLNYLIFAYGKKSEKNSEEIEHEFVKRVYQIRLIDGVKEFLEYLINNHYDLYVLSNTMFSTIEVEKELNQLGILKYFKKVLATGDHLLRKPSEMIFNVYLKYLKGIKNSDIAYVGNDCYVDMSAPIKLGMKAFLKSDCDKEEDGYIKFKSYDSLLGWFKNNG